MDTMGRRDLTPDDVAAVREPIVTTSLVKSKPRKARPDPRYKAQYRYQREAVLCRAWLRDNNPTQFRKICRMAGRRRPTYRIFKKRKKEPNGTAQS